jgi:hypothetical protein
MQEIKLAKFALGAEAAPPSYLLCTVDCMWGVHGGYPGGRGGTSPSLWIKP